MTSAASEIELKKQKREVAVLKHWPGITRSQSTDPESLWSLSLICTTNRGLKQPKRIISWSWRLALCDPGAAGLVVSEVEVCPVPL